MFTRADTGKTREFLTQAQLARQHRAEEKEREKAAVKIQSHARKFLCVCRLRNEIRLEVDKSVEDSSKKLPASDLFTVIRKFLFIFQEDKDDKRFLALCRYLLATMDAQTPPKMCYVSLAMSQKHVLMWIQQLKKVLWTCCCYLRKLKPHLSSDTKVINVYLNMLVIFTDCAGWRILSVKGGEALKPSMQQLCSNVLGFLSNKGYFQALKELLLKGLARKEPAISKVTLSAVITLTLRPVIVSNFSSNLLSLFLVNILSVPGLILHTSNIAQESLELLERHDLFKRSLDFLSDDQNTKITFNTLECSYALCLLANVIQLGQSDQKVIAQDDATTSKFVSFVSKFLLHCQAYVAKKQSNMTNWHPILGWFKQTFDNRLNDAMCHVSKQLQILWQKSTVQRLFNNLPSADAVIEPKSPTGSSERANRKSFSQVMSSKLSFKTEANYKLTSPEVQAVCNVCVMYQTLLMTLTQIKHDILTGLSYQEELQVRLWRFLQQLGSDGGLKMILGSISSGQIQCSTSVQSLLTLFCSCFGHLLPIIDDIELYEQQKPFSLEDLVLMSSFLNQLVFKLFWSQTAVEGKSASLPSVLDSSLLVSSSHTLLMLLYDRDCRRAYAPTNHWLIKELKMSTFQSELDSGKHRAAVVLQKIPHVLPHKERVQLFRKLVAKDKEALGVTSSETNPHSTTVTIHRSRILEDGYERLSFVPGHVMKGVIRIRFINEMGLDEAGIDQDGVFKEFLEETIKKAFDPGLNLFKLTSEQRLYPSPTSHFQDNHLQLFEFVGRMLAKATYEGIVVEVPFALFFLSQVLGHRHSALYSSIDELPSLDPELYKSLTFIKHYSGDIRDLELTFSFDSDILGKVVTHDLKPGGRAVQVTNDNKISYVHLMAHHQMCVQLREQTAAFIRGFRSIIHPEWLSMFSSPELQRLISGDNVGLDLVDLRNHTRYYGGYHNNHRVVNWLWDVLKNDFNDKERAAFLKFVTSCSKPPLLGFEYLEPAFSIRCVECEDDEDEGDTVGSVLRGFFNIRRRTDSGARLPTASTCFNLLKLPNYRKKGTLREKLRYAINSNAGFELS